jgi:chromosomal replication initiator protein
LSNQYAPRTAYFSFAGVAISADGADVLDSLTEIPLPGRILVSPTTNLAGQDAALAMPAFVAGPENRLVAATFKRLIDLTSAQPAACDEQPGRCWSAPGIIALFGASGVGKTHLAKGLVRHRQNTAGANAACYKTAADFCRLVNEAIDGNAISTFRSHYRKHQILVIDDIHRLPSGDYLMQELRYMLDAIEESRGILIVTSHRPPDTLANLPDDVRSRLSSGLALQLAPPSREARTRIIRHASLALGREVPAADATRIANGNSSTATEVLGQLFEYFLPAKRVNTGDANIDGNRGGPSVHDIIAAVARSTNVPQKVLKSASRKQSIVFARAIAIFLAREIAEASYDQIGRALGGRDHTTIMHNYKKIALELTTNAVTRETVADLRRQLAAS